MVAFATPPREPNGWFKADQPTPRPVSLLPAAPRRGLIRRASVPLGALGLVSTAIAMIAQIPPAKNRSVDEFARNRYAAQAEALLLARLGPAPRLSVVRAKMAAAQLFCRAVDGAGNDSLLTCLGHAVRDGSAYSRMVFRIASRGDSVTRVVACPSLVVRGTRLAAVPERISRARSAPLSAECWHDPANPLDAEWTWASLPATQRFTVVPDPDAPRMRLESAASADTITVIW